MFIYLVVSIYWTGCVRIQALYRYVHICIMNIIYIHIYNTYLNVLYSYIEEVLAGERCMNRFIIRLCVRKKGSTKPPTKRANGSQQQLTKCI